jgi:hypothetical protein
MASLRSRAARRDVVGVLQRLEHASICPFQAIGPGFCRRQRSNCWPMCTV